jgi:hypothetical protein
MASFTVAQRAVRRSGVARIGAVLAGMAMVLASTASVASAAPSSSSARNFQKILGHIKRTSGKTFLVTYTFTENGMTQKVTFAQKPPQEAIITPQGSFYINNKSSVIVCEGSSNTCTQLPASEAAAATSVTNLFSPGVLTGTLQGIEGEVAAHVAGIKVTTRSASYGGQRSTCATVKSRVSKSTVTYCASNGSGVLTHFSSGKSSGTLTAYQSNPPASTFSPPAGATINTLPSGV